MKLLAIVAVMAALASTLEAKNVNPLVIGGTDADKNEFPFLVGIWIGEGGATKELKCTGLIVDKKVVVTSAKCIDKPDGTLYDAADIEVIAGDHDISNDNDGEVKETVAQINIKDERNPDLNENDIVAFILTKALALTDTVAEATLPAADDDVADGQGGTVAGWGEKDGEPPVIPPAETKLKPHDFATILQKADVTTVARTDCENKFGFASVSAENFCAGSADGTVAICTGDLGSPLIVEAEGVKTVVGFVNKIANCEKDAAGALFTKLATHVAWIKEQIPEDPTDPDPSTEPSDGSSTEPSGKPSSDATGQTSDPTGQTPDPTGQTPEPTGQTPDPTNQTPEPTTPASGIMVKNNFWLLILAIPLLVLQH